MKNDRLKKNGINLAITVVVAAALALSCRIFFFELYLIPVDSMFPTLQKGDYVLGWKIRVQPERGDIVVFSFDENPSDFYLKRVVAIGGDEVEIKGGVVTVNGQTLGQTEVPRFKESTKENDALAFYWEENRNRKYKISTNRDIGHVNSLERITVPKGAVFALSDQRTTVMDDPVNLKPVSVENIRARIEIVAFSIDPKRGFSGKRLWMPVN